ncbi:hypothetical protein JCM25156A_16410 [Komagataeibacter kakiaceti JCM 25156]
MHHISFLPSLSRRSLRGLALLATAGCVLLGPGHGARAQVTTSKSALDALGAPQRPVATPHAGETGSTGGTGADVPDSHAPASAIASPAALASLPPIATQPPDNPVLRPPELHVPAHPLPLPPEVRADPQARGRAERIPGGTRLHFTMQSAAMNQRMISALQTFATIMLKLPEQHVNIAAYGEGRQDDPSTPRRVALSRGLAARSVLIHAGVAPTRIYVRAIGLPDENAQGAGADCIDVTRSGVVASVSSSSAH